MAQLATRAERAAIHQTMTGTVQTPRRAVAFGGGGPAVGISVGFLRALDEWNAAMDENKQPHRRIDFPVWMAGCVGGWLTCLYHLCRQPKAGNVEKQIRTFFRNDLMYDKYPSPTTFTPDIPGLIEAGFKYLIDPQSYRNLVVPSEIARGYYNILDTYLKGGRWNAGDFCYLMLNSALVPNPAARMMISLFYKPEIPGLNRLWFDKEYSLLNKIDLKKLEAPTHPDIYINSYNLATHRSDVYCNHPAKAPFSTQPITMEALCASSALPYILSPVKVDGAPHIEGALVDSFCFQAVHKNHQDLTEVWISQIVDHTQIREPRNLLDALNNLIMLYAGTTSRHDIQMCVNQLNHDEYARAINDGNHRPKWIECFRLPVYKDTNYFWSESNFDRSVNESYRRCKRFIKFYDSGRTRSGRRRTQASNLFVHASQFKGD